MDDRCILSAGCSLNMMSKRYFAAAAVVADARVSADDNAAAVAVADSSVAVVKWKMMIE